MEIKEILEAHGYPIIDGGNYLSTKAIFRGGDNPLALCIYPKDNLVIDFPNKERYDIKTLIGKILGEEDQKKVDEYIQNNDVTILSSGNQIEEKLIDGPKIINREFLDKLVPKHDYWVKRGINIETLKQLKGGVYGGRYYFPIWDNGNIVGLTARDVTGKSKVKWLHKGKKSEWIWPSMEPIEKEKEVFLVESPGDALSFMTCGVNNVLCVFGSDCSWNIVNALLRVPYVKINIAFNQDGAGRTGSIKTLKKFQKYFDKSNLFVKLPETNDWNDLLLKENGEEKLKSLIRGEFIL